MLTPGQKKIEAVIALPGPKAYEYFIKRVADWEEAWSLYQDGWALGETDEGARTFPLWPAKDYARLCAIEEWGGYEPVAIPLDELMDELLPNLKQDNVLPSVFPRPSGIAVHREVDVLLCDLRRELSQY